MGSPSFYIHTKKEESPGSKGNEKRGMNKNLFVSCSCICCTTYAEIPYDCCCAHLYRPGIILSLLRNINSILAGTRHISFLLQQ